MARSTETSASDPATNSNPTDARLMRETEITILGETLNLQIEVPDEPMGLADIVPHARKISNAIVAITASRAKSAGKPVSCRKGCSACCSRLLVVLSVPEALRLVQDIQGLAETHRAAVLGGFLERGRTVQQTKLNETLRTEHGGDLTLAECNDMLMDWWRKVHRDCPILQGGICSMYLHRPTVCREYLVVSDPALCTKGKDVEPLGIPVRMHRVLSRLAGELLGSDRASSAIIFPSLLNWYAAGKGLGDKTWDPATMLEKFLDILSESARSAADGESTPSTG